MEPDIVHPAYEMRRKRVCWKSRSSARGLDLAPMDRRRIRIELEENVRRTRDLREEAWARFRAALHEAGSGIPEPDGRDRISLAARRFNHAFRESARAHDELVEFIVNGAPLAGQGEESQ